MTLSLSCVRVFFVNSKEVSRDEEYSKNEWLVPCALNKLVFTSNLNKKKMAMIDRWRQRHSRRREERNQQQQMQ